MSLPEWPLAPTVADLEAVVARAREQLAGNGWAVAQERGEAFALLADRFARVLVDLIDGKILFPGQPMPSDAEIDRIREAIGERATCDRCGAALPADRLNNEARIHDGEHVFGHPHDPE